MKQAGSRSHAAPNWRIDWYFAEERFANLFRKEFTKAGHANITVYYREANIKKIDDCMRFVRHRLEQQNLSSVIGRSPLSLHYEQGRN